MSQQSQAEDLQREGIQALEELQRLDSENHAKLMTGDLSPEAYGAAAEEINDKIEATEAFIDRAARLNTISDRRLNIGDAVRRPRLAHPLADVDTGDNGGDAAAVAAERDRQRLNRAFDAFLDRQGASTLDGRGPILEKGSRPRALLNKALRHGRDMRPLAGVQGGDVSLSKEDWEFLYRPRSERLMNAYVDRDGGYITAEEMRNEMISLRTLATGLTTRFRTIATAAATVSFPTAHVVTSFQKRERTGQGQITPIRLTDVFGKTMFQPAGRDTIVKVPEELVEDATFDLPRFLAEEMNRISEEEDEQLGILGGGSGEPLGYLIGLQKLYGELAAPDGTEIGIDPGNDGVPAFTEANINPEFIQIFDTYVLPASGRANAVWTGPPQFERRVRLFRTDSGGTATGEFMFKRALEAGAPNTLNGFPLLTSQFFPDNFTSGSEGDPLFHFGDLRDMWWVVRSGLRLRVLAELYQETSEIGYKWQKRQDGGLVRADANIYARRQAA